MTDSEIISLWNGGEHEKAFNAIVGNYSERLYWQVRRIIFSHEDADDVVQEIFIKVWNALPSFRGEAHLFTWLYRIAVNESLNFIRRKKLREALSFKSSDEIIEKKVDDDPYFNANAAQVKLTKAMLRLPEKQRLVFMLRYFDEMKYEDISKILGTSVGALKASYHFAYEKLKHILLNL